MVNVRAMRSRVSIGLLALASLSGCVSSSSAGYEDVAQLPEDFVGKAHRAWVEESAVVIEVDQLPGLNISGIDYELEGDAIHLIPRRISSGGAGKTRFRIDLSAQHLAEDWQSHAYWLTGESYYPLGHSAFCGDRARTPTLRVRVEFLELHGECPSSRVRPEAAERDSKPLSAPTAPGYSACASAWSSAARTAATCAALQISGVALGLSG